MSRIPPTLDREVVIDDVILPAVSTIGMMTLGFLLVGWVVVLLELIPVTSYWPRMLALGVMYVFPHLVAGGIIGIRSGVSPTPVLVAAVSPIVVLAVALFAFGGPVATPLRNLVLTGGAVLVWGALFAIGLVLGDRVLDHRVSDINWWPRR